MDRELVDHLHRQSTWLRDSWLWILRDKVGISGTEKALEVGCGAGHVMEILAQHFDVAGIDNDPDMVEICRSKGLDVQLADAAELPFEDDSFDIVYCSFFLLWVDEPVKVLEEMARVSKSWVLCLGEPDYGGRIDHPPELEKLGQLLIDDLQSRGADPFIGRKLRDYFSRAGMEPEIGVHQGVWPLEKLRREITNELVWVPEAERPGLEKAIKDNEYSLFQYNPVFYAISKIK